jgi:hypothetical protein
MSSLKREAQKVFRKIRPTPILREPFKVLERLLVFSIYVQLYNNLDSCEEYSLRTWSVFGHWKKKKMMHFVKTIVQFTNARSIHSGFYQWRMIDDNEKRFIPHLAIDNDFFHRAFVNPCMM